MAEKKLKKPEQKKVKPVSKKIKPKPAKPKKSKKAKQKPKTKEFTVSFSKVFFFPKGKRARKAIQFLKKFMFKHFRAKEEQVVISDLTNREIWKNGFQKIPRKIQIQVLSEDNLFYVFLKGEKLPEKKKEEKDEKQPKEKPKVSEEEKEDELEDLKKLEDKKEKEKAAEKASIKRGTK